jgi:hypothetical protein
LLAAHFADLKDDIRELREDVRSVAKIASEGKTASELNKQKIEQLEKSENKRWAVMATLVTAISGFISAMANKMGLGAA